MFRWMACGIVAIWMIFGPFLKGHTTTTALAQPAQTAALLPSHISPWLGIRHNSLWTKAAQHTTRKVSPRWWAAFVVAVSGGGYVASKIMPSPFHGVFASEDHPSHHQGQDSSHHVHDDLDTIKHLHQDKPPAWGIPPKEIRQDSEKQNLSAQHPPAYLSPPTQLPAFKGVGLNAYDHVDELLHDLSSPINQSIFSASFRDDLVVIAYDMETLAYHLIRHWNQLSGLANQLEGYEAVSETWLALIDHLDSGMTFKGITAKEFGERLRDYSHILKNYLRAYYPYIPGNNPLSATLTKKKLHLIEQQNISLSNYMEADSYNIQIAAEKLDLAASWFVALTSEEHLHNQQQNVTKEPTVRKNPSIISLFQITPKLTEFMHDFSQNLYVSYVDVKEVFQTLPAEMVDLTQAWDQDQPTDNLQSPYLSALPQLLRSFSVDLRDYSNSFKKTLAQPSSKTLNTHLQKLIDHLATQLSMVATQVHHEVYSSYIDFLDIPFRPAQHRDLLSSMVALPISMPPENMTFSHQFAPTLLNIAERIANMKFLLQRLQQNMQPGKSHDHAMATLDRLLRHTFHSQHMENLQHLLLEITELWIVMDKSSAL
ncbi:MAG: hypothetical protein OXC44_02170 [Proteobacteria bacterium]|nr:hypothetical protein [Pseudomonadota bacterium]